jgi:hypothetical protein
MHHQKFVGALTVLKKWKAALPLEVTDNFDCLLNWGSIHGQASQRKLLKRPAEDPGPEQPQKKPAILPTTPVKPLVAVPPPPKNAGGAAQNRSLPTDSRGAPGRGSSIPGFVAAAGRGGRTEGRRGLRMAPGPVVLGA